jgi:glycerophosphoryl diester phosphodiesterase
VILSGLISVFFGMRLISRAEEATQSAAGGGGVGSGGGGGGGNGAAAAGPSSAFCGRPDPLVCAHGTVGSIDWDESKRGPRPLPNTVPALTAAVAAGHACVEVDVSRTKDGHLVALHSRELKRLTDGRVSNPGDVTLAEVLALTVPGRVGYFTYPSMPRVVTPLPAGCHSIRYMDHTGCHQSNRALTTATQRNSV